MTAVNILLCRKLEVFILFYSDDQMPNKSLIAEAVLLQGLILIILSFSAI